MRRRVIVASVVAAAVLCIGLIVFIRPSPPRGSFPPHFSDAEKWAIVSAANHDALRQALKALGHARVSEARRWLINWKKQTVRNIRNQGEGTILVDLWFDESAASHGYAIWARYIMKRENGGWVIDKGPF